MSERKRVAVLKILGLEIWLLSYKQLAASVVSPVPSHSFESEPASPSLPIHFMNKSQNEI